ncbi:hypothetical protein INS49_015632 [Diaporthe citri]|uniref:uncharacterized protein n=1 Tax=Diaporthe citri TaxID=83186 RepID=UPI001C8040F7|nr:uncharacterized protein INS49_015632 [Diaporthe citri]KAG6356245.1 hypothetical protein INS49_015632 [Diaporthe citri]
MPSTEAVIPKPVTQLLARLSENTTRYLEYFSERSLPEPSFEDGDGLSPDQELPGAIQAARNVALEATGELHRLLLGPIGLVMSCPGDHYLMLGIQYAYRYNLAQHVPLEGTATFDELAAATGANVKDVTRFTRLLTGWHVFHEMPIGCIAHTAASKQLLSNPKLQSWITSIAQEFWPSLARTVDATQQWPDSEEPNESGYSLGHHTDDNPFDVIKRDPARHQRYMDVQTFSHQHSSFSVNHLLDGYDFSNVHTLVDVGGGQGEVSLCLAKEYPNMEIIVQDQPEVIEGLENRIPAELKHRIRGMKHNFFHPQLVKHADIYLLRWIFHCWSDLYCVKILQSLVPGLKNGAKVVANDICIPQPGSLGIAADRELRQLDISLKAFNNARERDANAWEMLFSAADSRFKFLGIKLPQGASMAIIQAEWTGEDQQQQCKGNLGDEGL